MSEYKYSAKNNSFFLSSDIEKYEYAGWDLSDVVDVDNETFEEFIIDRAIDNKIRIAGDDGYPAWGDIPPPTVDELILDAEQKKSSLRGVADSEISWRQDAVDAGIATEEEELDLASWKKYRILLMRVDTSTAPEIEWPVEPEK